MTATNSTDILIEDVYFNVRATNTLRNWHEFDSEKRPPLKTLGDIAKLSQYELLRVPNCGKLTIKDIEEALAKHGLYLKDRQPKVGRDVMVSMGRLKEMEDKNDRLLMELGYLQGEVAKVDAYKEQIAKLEHRIVDLERSNSIAWGVVKQIKDEQNITRDAAAKSIMKLQTEMHRMNVSRETLKGGL
jgi:hypothetical protein